jgi:hypothetical protein
MSVIKNTLKPVQMTTVDITTLTTSYTPQKTFDQPLVIMRIVNDSNRDISISWNNSTDHDYVIQGQTLQIDCGSGLTDKFSGKCLIASGTRLSFKVASGSGTGNLYVTGYYQPV